MFRYIPDRDTIQRLLMRCSNMKDDLAEFEINEDDIAAGQAEEPDLSPELHIREESI